MDIEKTPSMFFSKALVRLKYIQHIQEHVNEQEAARLVDGKRKDKWSLAKIDFLNQSYIFHLIACWQVFNEDLVLFGLKRIKGKTRSNRMTNLLEDQITAKIKRFNTPSTEEIDKLFAAALGIQKITMSWQGSGITRDQATSTLDAVLTARHEVAHKGKTGEALSYQSNFDRMEIIFTMAQLMEKRVMKECPKRR